MSDTSLLDGSDPSLSLVLHAVAQIRDAILWVRYPPGAKLKVMQVREDLGLSSTPVREALNRLVAEGLVSAEDRRGFRVADVTPDDFADITRVRLLVETDALRSAIERGGDDWEAGVLAAFHRLSSVERRLPGVAPALDRDWSDRHRAFHMALLDACGSPNLLRVCVDFHQRAERFRRISARHRSVPRNKNDEHERLMRAALAHDAEGAAALLSQHIRHTAVHVLAAIEARPAGAGGAGL